MSNSTLNPLGEVKSEDVLMKVNTAPSSNTQTKTNLEFSRQNMKCTDIGCCVCFSIYLLGMLIVAGIATGTGSPMRLIYGTDYMGATCATGPNEASVAKELAKLGATPKESATYWQETSWDNYYKNRKDITYPRTNIDQLVQKLTGAANTGLTDFPTLPNFYGLCVTDCPISREDLSKSTLGYETYKTMDQLAKTHNIDVVCSIQASKKIQKTCLDTTFTSQMNTSVFDATPNAFDEYEGTLRGALQQKYNQWTFAIAEKEMTYFADQTVPVTQIQGTTAVPVTVSGLLKKSVAGKTIRVVIVAADDVVFEKNLDIVIGAGGTATTVTAATITSVTNNGFSEYGTCTDTTGKKCVVKYGSILDGGYSWMLPWAPIAVPEDGKCDSKGSNCGVIEEQQCLTQFFDRCAGDGEGTKKCRALGASEESLQAVNSDCWKQAVNSISVVNRCVASRNVDMKVVCKAPIQTVNKVCTDYLGNIVKQAGTNDNLDVISGDVCRYKFIGSDGKKINDTRRFVGPSETQPYLTKWVCPGADGVYSSHGDDDCWKEGPDGKRGSWLVTSYNNTGSAELSPAEIAARVHGGDSGISNTGYCSDSMTITNSVYGVKTSELYAWLNGAGKTAAGWFADFQKTKTPILVSGIVLSMILAFSWIVLMKNFGKCVCWTTLILSLMTCIALNLALYVKAGIIGADVLGNIAAFVATKDPEIADQIPNAFPDYLQPSETRKALYKWSAIAMTVFLLIVFVAMVRFRQKINVAIQMCKEAAAAIVDMPLIIFWPFLNVFLLVVLMVYFIFIAMYIASAANLQTANVGLKAAFDEKIINMKNAANTGIDYANAAGAAGTNAANAAGAAVTKKYNQNVKDDMKAGLYSDKDWNAVSHMQYNASTVQPLNFNANTAIRYMLGYHTIGMWWVALVIVTVGNYTIASSVSQWYFNAGKYLEQSINRAKKKYAEPTNFFCCKCSVREQMDSPITDSCKKGCRYHVGSFAMGSALNILVFFLKFGFLWINKLVAMITGRNALARKIKACMFLAMGFFDKFIRIVSRNGYIMMAIRGENFCKSAGWASWLIFAAQDNPKNLESGAADLEDRDKRRKAYNVKQRKNIEKLKKLTPGATVEFMSFSFVSGGEVQKEVNINTEQSKERQIAAEEGKLTSYEGPYKEQSYNAAQYAVLSLITDILLFLGKLVVVVSTGLMSYGWITHDFKPGQLTSSAAPIAVSMLFSYFIVSAFMSVYDMSIDTILLCFFYDKLQNKGGPYAMSPQLKKLVLANLPPGVDKTNMRAGDSFFFSQQVTRQGTISIGAGWDAEQSQPTGKAGSKSNAQMDTASNVTYISNPEMDIDLAMAIFDKDAKLLDYIGYMEAVRPNGKVSMALKKTAGGNLFVDKPQKSLSNINPEAVRWSGDDKNGAKSGLNIAGLNEDITVRLHEMPINVDTLAFVLFSFKGPCFNEISDLRLFATECTQSIGNDNRRPEVVAKFNCDFDKDSLEGAQQALLCVTLRRNAGPTFPSGKIEWDAKQIEFARKFCSKKIKNENFCDYQQKNITSQLDQLGVSQESYVTIVSACESAHEDAYDQILSEEKKHKGIGRGLQQKIALHKEKVAADIIFNVWAKASEKTGKKLSAQQIMIWNRTYSEHNHGLKGDSPDSFGDMIGEKENYFDCAWEIQAQRQLMGMKKFNASCMNSIAKKCFFFRDPSNKIGQANGSYCGAAVAATAGFLASA